MSDKAAVAATGPPSHSAETAPLQHEDEDVKIEDSVGFDWAGNVSLREVMSQVAQFLFYEAEVFMKKNKMDHLN